jgi:hypothetical protein
VAGGDDLDAVAALDRGHCTRALGNEIAVARRGDALAREPQLRNELVESRSAGRQLVAVDDDLASVFQMRGQGALPQLSERQQPPAPIQ